MLQSKPPKMVKLNNYQRMKKIDFFDFFNFYCLNEIYWKIRKKYEIYKRKKNINNKQN